MSRELILKMSMSIDGYVAGPNGELDWVFRSSSEASRTWLIELLGQAGLHAMGHRTYQDMAGYWPTSPLPMARPMNEIPKVVFSRSGKISAPDIKAANGEGRPAIDDTVLESWRNPLVAGTDLAADIQRLKQEEGKPILAHGGASFASSLIAANLVDKIILAVHPVALGCGLPIFAGLDKPLDLRLEDLIQFDTGAVVKIYRPA
ncbi:dihydrofolate reductase family protein [Fimbriimonas ginsengisoli]|nr:dihydrofolate reductase family protein [Fimbriimonas ginsengisoli]